MMVLVRTVTVINARGHVATTVFDALDRAQVQVDASKQNETNPSSLPRGPSLALRAGPSTLHDPGGDMVEAVPIYWKWAAYLSWLRTRTTTRPRGVQ